jgi:hypothetical protein
METNYSYFIEDFDTKLWYRNTFHLQPTCHTFGKGWDKPTLSSNDYWTNDPNQTISFKSLADANEFLANGFKKVGSKNQFTNNPQFQDKILIITEHEFIDSPSDLL